MGKWLTGGSYPMYPYCTDSLVYHYCTETFQLNSSSVVHISDMYIFVWFDAWHFMKKYDILTQCVQNLVIPYVLLFFFYILSPWGDNNIDVQSDLIFARSEEVYTSDHIDEFITSQKTCLRWKYILIFFF